MSRSNSNVRISMDMDGDYVKVKIRYGGSDVPDLDIETHCFGQYVYHLLLKMGGEEMR